MERIKLSEIAYLLNGYAFKSAKYVERGIRIIRIANVQDGYIADDKPCYYPLCTDEDISKYMLTENDLLISLTGNVGRVGMLTKGFLPAALNQRVSCIRIKDSDTVNKKYLYYYFRQKLFIQECVEASKGVAQLNLSTKWLENYTIPVPPLPEQERIVARIEELFSQLDAGVETLKKTKAQLAVYRQAVLKEAFEGRLTQAFREENGLPDWKTISITQAIAQRKNALKAGPFGSALKKECYVPSGYKVYGQEQVIANNENIGNYYIDEEKYQELISCAIAPHDILISLVGTVGKVLVLSDNCLPGIINPRLIKITLDEKIMMPYFFKYYFESAHLKSLYKKKAHGATMDVLNMGMIKELPFPLCDIQEQGQVIKEIESRLSICDSIEHTVDLVLQQAEAMRQSILKEAFEGKL